MPALKESSLQRSSPSKLATHASFSFAVNHRRTAEKKHQIDASTDEKSFVARLFECVGSPGVPQLIRFLKQLISYIPGTSSQIGMDLLESPSLHHHQRRGTCVHVLGFECHGL